MLPARVASTPPLWSTVLKARLLPIQRSRNLRQLSSTRCDEAISLDNATITESAQRHHVKSCSFINRLSLCSRRIELPLPPQARFNLSYQARHCSTFVKSILQKSTTMRTEPNTPAFEIAALEFGGQRQYHSNPDTPATTPSATPALELELEQYSLTEEDLANISNLLVEIAKDAGQIMLSAEHEFLIAASTKNNTSDLVTKYDSQIESMVEERTRAAYPTFSFLGEETFKHGTKLSPCPTFVCDPIDGTLNFSKGVPNCAISLALTLNKKPIIGVVYNPFRGDMYWAIKNRGAYLTKMSTNASFKLPLQSVPPPMPSLRSCLVAIEWGNQRSGPNWALRTDVHKVLLTDKSEGGAFCKSVRSNGSAALDFCYVAQGNIDCFWEGGVWIWDVCAGWIILEEAGGLVASANPGDWEPELEGRCYFAVRSAKREEQKGVVEELWNIMGDRKFIF